MPRSKIGKVRESQHTKRKMLAKSPPNVEGPSEEFRTAENGLYLYRLGARLDAIRHGVLVDELLTIAKEFCQKECAGCKVDSLCHHGSFCDDNVAILLQRFVEHFLDHLLARNKDGDYFIDERFAMIIDALVPAGLEIREAFSFPSYVLVQYFMRVANPTASKVLTKLGLNLSLNPDIAHGIDNVGVMSTMLSVLCDKKCLTPLANLLGWEKSCF